MNKGIIITLPNADFVTDYLSKYSSQIIKEAENRNINIKTLTEKKANRAEFESSIKKLNYKMLVFNGHGSKDSIEGHNNTIIDLKNAELLKDRITYARCCDAAAILGNESMKNNKEGCFIGYLFKFMLYIDENRETNPKKDSIAPLFLQPSNLIPISIIKGNTASAANVNSKKQTLKNINKMMRSGKVPFLLINAMWNNYSGQILIGNENATL